ncbi:MAG: phage tail tape measure protein [Candidatus Heimdallarchaeaceae archaeon]
MADINTKYIFDLMVREAGIEAAAKHLAGLKAEIKDLGSTSTVKAFKSFQDAARRSYTTITTLHSKSQQLTRTIQQTSLFAKRQIPTTYYPGAYSVKTRQPIFPGPSGLGIYPAEIIQGRTYLRYPSGMVSKAKEAVRVQEEMGDVVSKNIRVVNQYDRAQKNLIANFAKLGARAVAVIPIWMALRNVYMSLINVIREGVRHIVEFDKALGRAQAVTRGVGVDIQGFMRGLREEIQQLALDTGRSVSEIAEAYYRFGTAGRNAIEAQEGMKIALKTAVAMMGDVTSTARSMADIYNVLGNRIEGATTIQEKMQMIGATIATLWRRNAFELGEFTQGMKNFASTAANLNLTFDQTATLVAVSHTLMQRAGTSGTQLTRVFLQMMKNIERVNMLLGRYVDLSKENAFDIFLEVLKAINTQFEGASQKARVVADIFGIRGARNVQAFTTNIDLLISELERLQSMPLAARLRELNDLYKIQAERVDFQIGRFRQLRQVIGHTFIEGITGTTSFAEALKEINEFLENSLIPTMKALNKLIAVQKFLRFGPISLGQAIEKGRQKAEEEYVKQLSKTADALHQQYLKKKRGQEEEKKRLEEIKKLDEGLILTFEEKIRFMEILKTYGYNDIEIARIRYELAKKQGDLDEMRRQQLAEVNALVKEQVKYAQQLQSTFSEAFASLIKGEVDLKGVLERIANFWRDSLIEAFAEGFTQQIFKATGIGDIFVQQVVGLKRGLSGSIETAHLSGILKGVPYIVQAHQQGMQQGTVAPTSATTGVGGLGRMINLSQGKIFGWTLPGFGPGGWWTQPVGGKREMKLTYVSEYGKQKGYKVGDVVTAPGPTRGEVFGQWMGRGIALYSLYQLSQARGGNVVGGAIQGAMAGYTLGGPVGAVLGAIYGGVMSARPKVTETWNEYTKQVTSRIDVTNKQLQIVNRNLLALKNVIETYMLPESAYFAEKRNIEDQFSLNARRGG